MGRPQTSQIASVCSSMTPFWLSRLCCTSSTRAANGP